MTDIVEKFEKLDTPDFPDFYSYKTPLERGLWILWVVKEKLGIKKLHAEQIASIIRVVKETSTEAKSIIYAFNRAGDKIHTYLEEDTTYFEIMKTGKDYLLSQAKGSLQLFYFEPDKRFTSKRTLSKDILSNLKGEIKVVDPYCGERTLDILRDCFEGNDVKFLTRVENVKGNKRTRFLRELKDFKSEYGNVEFRTYPYTDIHDRYIISSGSFFILGHSIKDLGSKESFAILLNISTNKNIVEALIENFNRRWKQSRVI